MVHLVNEVFDGYHIDATEHFLNRPVALSLGIPLGGLVTQTAGLVIPGAAQVFTFSQTKVEEWAILYNRLTTVLRPVQDVTGDGWCWLYAILVALGIARSTLDEDLNITFLFIDLLKCWVAGAGTTQLQLSEEEVWGVVEGPLNCWFVWLLCPFPPPPPPTHTLVRQGW
jgi:hypothetical protein